MTSNNINPLYLIIKYVIGYSEENNGNKYLTLIPAEKNKDKLKNYAKIWSKTKSVRSINNNSDAYDEKYMKIKFHSSVDLPLKKTLREYDTIIVVKSVFNEGYKYYSQLSVDDCL